MRIIFHIDVNSAFLSWSALKQLEEQPGSVDLRTIPSAVGGDILTRHGIITAKSIPAKKYGIKTGEPVVKALQKCPELVLVRSDFETYRRCSKTFIAILRSYTGQVEQVSIDEAFVDVTDLLPKGEKALVRKEAERLADRIRERVKTELGFTVNAGISENKLLAKMASDFAKPDRTHTLYPEEVPAKMWPLPIRDLFGCGQATAGKLIQMGITTIGEAARTDPAILKSVLGEKGGEYLYRSANGLGSDRVHTEQEEAKGYSNETTLPFDITEANYRKEMPPVLSHLAEKVAGRLARDGVYAKTIGVMVKTDDFRRRSRQRSLAQSTNGREEIKKEAAALMDELLLPPKGLFAEHTGIRLVGVSCTNLDHGEYRQMNLLEWQAENAERRKESERAKKLEEMMRKIREKHGENAVKRGGGL